MSDSESMRAAFEKAVTRIGGQSKVSRQLKAMGLRFSQQRLWHHLRVKGACPIELVIPLEKLSGVGRHELRPDLPELFPAPAEFPDQELQIRDRRVAERRNGERRSEAA